VGVVIGRLELTEGEGMDATRQDDASKSEVDRYLEGAKAAVDQYMEAAQEGYAAGHARALNQAAQLVLSMRRGPLRMTVNAYQVANLIRKINPNDGTG
jgi:hypothetical protein